MLKKILKCILFVMVVVVMMFASSLIFYRIKEKNDLKNAKENCIII